MIIILRDETTHRKWMVKPMGDGRNWQLYAEPVGELVNGKLVGRNGHEIKEPWVFQDVYASSVEQAVRMAMERMLKSTCDEEVVEAESSKVAEIVGQAVEARVRQIKVDITNLSKRKGE